MARKTKLSAPEIEIRLQNLQFTKEHHLKIINDLSVEISELSNLLELDKDKEFQDFYKSNCPELQEINARRIFNKLKEGGI
ncbi:MAG: hypothetical protein ACRCZQ_01315 [Bacteroidales bacterium]